ncbi:MAG TPA: thioredoxin family protein [Saprospiraceae bacterium]|nr:thioredoxin family protein [Saprospiraceae bacterium]
MKGRLFFLLIFLCVTATMQGTSNPDKAFGHAALEEVNTRAWRQGKMIVIDFTAEWCLPCQMMEEHTFSSPGIIEILNQEFVAVQYDIQSFDGVALKSEYSIKSLPTLLVLHPDGTELKRLQGAMSATELLSELKSVLSTHRIEKQEHYGLERPPLRPKEQETPLTIGSSHVIQLGLFSDRENAHQMMLKMPVDSRIVSKEKEGHTYWALVSKQSGTAAEMKALKIKLDKQGISCFLIQGPS